MTYEIAHGDVLEVLRQLPSNTFDASEMIGAMQAGWSNVIGIEGEADYINIAHARIAHWIKRGIAA